MREIKFRGKRSDGQWVTGAYYKDDMGTFVFAPGHNYSYSTYRVEPETVGQFTGMLDKNGKEIYEGDILDCIAEKDYAGETGHKVVIWNNHELRVDVTDEISTTYGLPMIWGGYETIEVIGNIHENPELLGGR